MELLCIRHRKERKIRRDISEYVSRGIRDIPRCDAIIFRNAMRLIPRGAFLSSSIPDRRRFRAPRTLEAWFKVLSNIGRGLQGAELDSPGYARVDSNEPHLGTTACRQCLISANSISRRVYCHPIPGASRHPTCGCASVQWPTCGCRCGGRGWESGERERERKGWMTLQSTLANSGEGGSDETIGPCGGLACVAN